MNKIWISKLQIFCLAFVAHSVLNTALANTIQFAVDASLEQQELDVVSGVVMTISQATDNRDSIGLVVYDDVFQLAAPIATANIAQKTRVMDALSNLSSSSSSNLAIGIEKGLSELTAEGGYLLVFGQSEIQVADPDKLTTYTDWLKLVLLPDSEKNGINVVLISPAARTDSASFQTDVTAYVQLSDVDSVINDLSTVLPEALVNRLGYTVLQQPLNETGEPLINSAEIENTPDITDIAVAEEERNSSKLENEANIPAIAALDEDRLSRMQLVLIGVSSLLLAALLALAYVLVKLYRKSKKHKTENYRQTLDGKEPETVSKPSALRRNPIAADEFPTTAHEASTRNKFTDATVTSAKARSASAETVRIDFDTNNTVNRVDGNDATQFPRHGKVDEKMEEAIQDLDATLKNPAVHSRNTDATFRNTHPAENDSYRKTEAETIDDLDEIRALTKLREDSFI